MDDKQFQAALTELKTLHDILLWGQAHFEQAGLVYGHGTDNAWDEALAIITACLDLPADCPREYLHLPVTLEQRQQILALFKRRIEERIPAAYLIHRAYFMGLPFYVDERVLIPRSPLAEFIEDGVDLWIASDLVHRICDMATGSGCIAIAMAYKFDHAMVDAVDISEEALEVAKRNIEDHQLRDRVTPIQSDLFQQLGEHRYDIIISNPPYVDANDLASLPPEYSYEPKLGLAAGVDGLAIVERILKQASHHLTSQGILVVEVGNSQQALIEKFPQVPFIWLEFARGGDGVFLLTADELQQHFGDL